ncbi:hypothetical protein ACFL0G_05560 [Candidatus Zixiibacteriota bacterium]
MKTLSAILFSLTLLTLACRDYDIIAGRSCFAPHPPPSLYGWGQNLPESMMEGRELRFQGVYAQEPYGRLGMIRRFDSQAGWSHVTLTGALETEQGSLVEVRGSVIAEKIALRGTGRTLTVNKLSVQDQQILCDTAPLHALARREYAKTRDTFQEMIASPGSRLNLAADPNWRVDWIGDQGAFVVTAHSYDLMYAAEVQFLFSENQKRIQTVYFYDWFKGE